MKILYIELFMNDVSTEYNWFTITTEVKSCAVCSDLISNFKQDVFFDLKFNSKGLTIWSSTISRSYSRIKKYNILMDDVYREFSLKAFIRKHQDWFNRSIFFINQNGGSVLLYNKPNLFKL